MMQAEQEYFSPSQNYFYDISANYYDLLKEIQRFQINKLTFKVFHHPGPKDGVRFYINSVSPIWSLFRKISLPHITKLTIKKLLNENLEIEFSFTLTIKNEYRAESYKAFRLFENVESTETATNILARKGQGKYKNNLLETMNTCCFTGITDVLLLRASHIKPWSKSTDFERLDPYNGVILTPTYDVLFDRGLISFENNGELLISPLLSKKICIQLSLIAQKIYNIENEHGNRSQYFEYHRTHIFKAF